MSRSNRKAVLFCSSCGHESHIEGGLEEALSGNQDEVTDVGDDVIEVDFNSPLAGETLEFDIEIINVN